MSYKVIAGAALNAGLTQLEVIEDDADLSKAGADDMKIVYEYLHALGDWDIFSGVIADAHPNSIITSAECFKGIQFITINKMTSMVHNIYNLKALQLLRDWDAQNDDPVSNTIDRYLEEKKLKVVVALPYVTGHRSDLKSTLWHIDNYEYSPMILSSQQLLFDLLANVSGGENVRLCPFSRLIQTT